MSGQVYNVPFAQIPEWILDAEISDRAVRLFCALHRHANDSGYAFPGRSSLAERLRCSKASIDRALNELREIGAIVSRQVVENEAVVGNDYWLWPADPSSPVSRGRRAGDATPRRAGDAGVGAPTRLQEREPLNESQLEREDTPVELALAVTPPPSVVDELCDELAERIYAHQGYENKPAITTRWRNDMRLLMKRGPLRVQNPEPMPPDRIRKAVATVFGLLAEPGRDGFCWANQIRSPGALRDHWAQIYAAARQAQRGAPSSSGPRVSQSMQNLAASRERRLAAERQQPTRLQVAEGAR